MKTKVCRACGGDGVVDEGQAERLGFTIMRGRTAICPVCRGTGAPPPFPWRAVVVVAVLVILGAAGGFLWLA